MNSNEDIGTGRPLRVVKLGGSLLTWPKVWQTFEAWYAKQPSCKTVLIVGGGPWVELLRQTTTRFEIGTVAAHHLSVRAMGLTARLAAACLPSSTMVDRYETLMDVARCQDEHQSQRHGHRPAGLCVFDVEGFLEEHEPKISGEALPIGWQATSDSIAARLAVCLDAVELVLLKSQEAPIHASHVPPSGDGSGATSNSAQVAAVSRANRRQVLAGCAATGYLDDHFPRAAHSLRSIRLVNLRSAAAVESIFH